MADTAETGGDVVVVRTSPDIVAWMEMTAITLREHGGPEVLRAERLPIPEPGPGEVRVRVRAVALNHFDLWVRRGGPAFKLEYPHRLGSDIAGTIDAIGVGRRGHSRAISGRAAGTIAGVDDDDRLESGGEV